MLGAVQGLTEFIPISSSGHLVLVPEALEWPSPGLTFDVLLHAASLLALVAYFSGDLIDLGRGVAAGDPAARKMLALLLIGTLPAGLAGIFLGDYFASTFEDARASAIQLVVTAFILVGGEQALALHRRRRARTGAHLRSVGELGGSDAGIIGIAQAVSILPGISRSGSTIGAGLALAVAREDSARFAFLLAIPALLGAALFKLPELREGDVAIGAGSLGFLASLVTSYGAIAILLRYLKTRTLYPFAIYCIVAGVVFYVIV